MSLRISQTSPFRWRPPRTKSEVRRWGIGGGGAPGAARAAGPKAGRSAREAGPRGRLARCERRGPRHRILCAHPVRGPPRSCASVPPPSAASALCGGEHVHLLVLFRGGLRVPACRAPSASECCVIQRATVEKEITDAVARVHSRRSFGRRKEHRTLRLLMVKMVKMRQPQQP